MATTHSTSVTEKVLFISESPPAEHTFNTHAASGFHQNAASSAYQTQSSSSSSKSEHHSSYQTGSTGGQSQMTSQGYKYNTLPVAKATAEVHYLDANHNEKPSEIVESSEIVALKPIIPNANGRRFQSESAVAEMKPTRVAHEVSRSEIHGGGMVASQTEQVHAEYRDTGHATMSTSSTSKVRRRNTGNYLHVILWSLTYPELTSLDYSLIRTPLIRIIHLSGHIFGNQFPFLIRK